VILACAACLLPFVNKAYHIDDPLFLYAARHIHAEPLNFYGFIVNWYGTAMPMWDVMQNPPLACYYIALAAALFGWSEPALHLAFLLPAVGAIWGTYRLAARCCTRPAIAALATLLTPAFLVSSTGVMSDTLALCFWVWAVVFWDRGLRTPHRGFLYLAAALVACAALTKYIGIGLIPLLLAYTLVYGRSQGKRPAAALAPALALAIPLLVLGAYQWATVVIYGHGLIFQAGTYALTFRKPLDALGLDVATSLGFLGGGAAGLLCYLPWLWSRRVLLIALAITALLTWAFAHQLAIGLHQPGAGDVSGLTVVQFGAFTALGFAVLALTGAALWAAPREPVSWLLGLWVAGIMVFATFLNWSMNVRSVLPLLPAAGILLARRLDQRFGAAGDASDRWAFWPLVPAGALALAVTRADYQTAAAGRVAAADIAQHCRDHAGTLWYQGHWGFQYYMDLAGAAPLDFDRYERKTGDLVVFPQSNTNVDARFPPGPWVKPVYYRLEVATCPWLATMDESVGAGFYAAGFGRLPFAFGETSPSRYRVTELAPFPGGQQTSTWERPPVSADHGGACVRAAGNFFWKTSLQATMLRRYGMGF
jgi:4-amino-4-deoxy-L-arabinose transferase-like glycosyltransferase